MKIELHDRLGNIQTINATRIVCYDMYNNPISVTVEVDAGIIIALTAEHEDFNETLKNLGIHKTVIVHDAPQKSLPEIRIPQFK